VLDLPVENRCRVTRILPRVHGFDLEVDRDGRSDWIPARRVVLATGREGMARPRIPAPLAPLLGPRCHHSAEAIDFSGMTGLTVAVIGLSAAAVDNAAEALEAGARCIHLLARAEAMPRINKMKSTVYPGFTHGFPDLDARARIALLSYVSRCRIAPPRESVQRVFRHPNARLHLGCELSDAVRDGDRFILRAGAKAFPADRIICCTGFAIDVAATPELGPFADRIRTFRDVIADDDPDVAEFLDFPDLGAAFEFQERLPGTAPYLAGLHSFTYAATVSHGNVSGDIPCVSDGAERLARGIAAAIFAEDFPAHLAALRAYEEPELLGDEIARVDAWDPDL
jgi:cation diffusion facilitator CzcD-associated flavoprotein CzcO